MKRRVRKSSAILHACTQWELKVPTVSTEISTPLRQVIGLSQHHDAVSGTENQVAVDDYNTRLDYSVEMCMRNLAYEWNKPKGKQKYFYNSLGWDRVEYLNGKIYKIPAGSFISETDALIKTDETVVEQKYDTIYKIENEFYKVEYNSEYNELLIEDKELSRQLQPQVKYAGQLSVTPTFKYYESCAGINCDDLGNSGAYIFRPANNGSLLELGAAQVTKTTQNGLKLSVSDFITYEISLENDLLVLSYDIGEIPVDEKKKIGKEIVLKFDINTQNYGHESRFFTDTNSYGFIERSREIVYELEPVSSRYWPITSRAYLDWGDKAVNPLEQERFEIFVDRAAGVASLTEPLYRTEMEIMLHRRTLSNDHKGADPMDDTSSVQGKIVFNVNKRLNNIERTHLEKRLNYPIVEFYSETEFIFEMRR